MSGYRIQKATRGDRAAIRRLVWKVRINPFRLRWENFVVAVADDHTLVGCGQLKPHGSHTKELASIAVEKAFRKRGVARAVIEELTRSGPRPLFLICLPELTEFYTRFGFSEVDSQPIPRHFARLRRISKLARRFHRSRYPVVMQLE